MITFYRQSNDDTAVDSFAELLDFVCSSSRPVIAFGDFNLPEIVWLGPSVQPMMTHLSRGALMFLDAVNRHSSVQHVCQPTRVGNLLDLFLTSINEVYCEVDDGYFESDHSQLLVSVSVPRVVGAPVTRSTAYCYRRADFSALRDALRLLPWNVLDTMSVDGAVDQFYAWVNAAIVDHIHTTSTI